MKRYHDSKTTVRYQREPTILYRARCHFEIHSRSSEGRTVTTRRPWRQDRLHQ